MKQDNRPLQATKMGQSPTYPPLTQGKGPENEPKR